MTETEEAQTVTEQASEPKVETQPQPPIIDPDVITNLPKKDTIDKLTESIKELQQVQRAIYEQQAMKGGDDDNAEEKLTY